MPAIELLAPARTADIGIAAINCGADAVYIGAESFGARADAGNSIDDIARLAAYAHQYYARVYVALNTLLFDHELPLAEKLIRQLSDVSIDGLIIQDMGLLELDLPPIPLIASTQMHNTTPVKVQFLEQAGFQRVILARELSLEQIRAIRAATTIELEFFVHGALCVSYSGQCYLSHALGGRSGNRGQCAQPCRKKYSLTDEQGRTLHAHSHFLSLKDLNLADHLGTLLEAGITSFKIEGRLKDMAYVQNITALYRQKLDALIDGKKYFRGSSGSSIHHFTPHPGKTFNRGFTAYNLTGTTSATSSPLTPKSLGEEIGPVQSALIDHFTLSDPRDLAPGDGICFFAPDRTLLGTQIHKVDGQKIYPDNPTHITAGVVIYRNHAHAFIKQLERSAAERKIGVTFTLSETPEGFTLAAVDDDLCTASFSLAYEKQPAQKQEQAQAAIRGQLSKLGNTVFSCREINAQLKEAYFFPVAVLNQLRRGVIAQLMEVRQAAFPRLKAVPRVSNNAPYPEKHLTFTGNVLNQKAAAFYKRHGVETIEPAAESGMDLTGQQVMTTKYCLKNELGMCGKKSGLTGPWFLKDTEGHVLELRTDCPRRGMDIYLRK